MRQIKASARERRIILLAQKINQLMRAHAVRNEAIDAYDIARVLFRKERERKELFSVPLYPCQLLFEFVNLRKEAFQLSVGLSFVLVKFFADIGNSFPFYADFDFPISVGKAFHYRFLWGHGTQ